VKLAFIVVVVAVLSFFEALAVTPAGETKGAMQSGSADGTTVRHSEPALTGERHLLYRLHKSDTLEIRFTFSPEYDQTVTVQPDGFIPLKGASTVLAEGRTMAEISAAVIDAYAFMRDPEINLTLRDFEKPFFLASGQLGHPGRYELRSRTTVTEAIAIAGGFTEQSKHSEVVLFRRAMEGFVEARVLNVKAMLSARNLDEDPELSPGDMLYVPQNRISKIKKYLPVSSLSTFFSPTQF
jgi:polysaccharide biosynthesis/export protein